MKILLSLIGNTIGTTGGVEKVLCNMANAMVARGHEVTILAFENKEGKPFFYLDERVHFLNLGIGHKLSHFLFNITSFYFNKDKKEFKRLLTDCNQIANIIGEKIKSIKTDILITFEQRSEVLFKEFIDLNIPIITMFHFNYENVLRNKQLYYIYEKSDCLQVLTQHDLKETRKLIKSPEIVWIPNAVPQSEKQAKFDIKTIITVGRIDNIHKRQHLLIEAFKLLNDRYPEWTLDIYGDTSFNTKYYNKCCELIKKYNLADKVRFYGITKDVESVLLNSSIFAFPSTSEGFGLALAEGMSAGLPAIGYKNCPAVNELIKDGKTGFLCDDGVEPLAEALDKLMRDKDLCIRMGRDAKADMAQFAPEKIWNQWEELMKKLLNHTKK